MMHKKRIKCMRVNMIKCQTLLSYGNLYSWYDYNQNITRWKLCKTHLRYTPSPTYKSKVKVIQRTRMYTTCCLMVIHLYAKIWYACAKKQRRSCRTQIHGESINLILRSRVKVIQRSWMDTTNRFMVIHSNKLWPEHKAMS